MYKKNKKGSVLLLIYTVLFIFCLILFFFGSILFQDIMIEEGKSLLGNISAAEKLYYSSKENYYKVKLTDYNDTLNIDSRNNRYFKKFVIVVPSPEIRPPSFRIITSGVRTASGITLILDGSTSSYQEVKIILTEKQTFFILNFINIKLKLLKNYIKKFKNSLIKNIY